MKLIFVFPFNFLSEFIIRLIHVIIILFLSLFLLIEDDIFFDGEDECSYGGCLHTLFLTSKSHQNNHEQLIH